LERLNDLFRDYKPQTNSLSVHLSGVLEASKELKEFDTILLLDTDASILNIDDDLVATYCWRINLVIAVSFVKG
jgi:hypothetical protein